MLLSRKTFSQYICQLILTVHIFCRYQPVLYHLSDKMTVNLYLFCSLMKHMIGFYLQCCFAITKYHHLFIDFIFQLFQKCCDPNHFWYCIDHTFVFSLYWPPRNQPLFLWLPWYYRNSILYQKIPEIVFLVLGHNAKSASQNTFNLFVLVLLNNIPRPSFLFTDFNTLIAAARRQFMALLKLSMLLICVWKQNY